MVSENAVFERFEAQQTLFDSRRKALLTPEGIDWEMQFPHSSTRMKISHLSQEGLEHFVSGYGSTYRVLDLDDCTHIKDLSPLSTLENLEALRIQRCRVGGLWDFSKNHSLRILSIHESRKIAERPAQLRTAPALEEISFFPAMGDCVMESLACFAGMRRLRRLALNGIRLKDRSMSALTSLPALEEFHFEAGMLTTEEIARIAANYPDLRGECLGVYTQNDPGCMNDIRICGYRKPGLDLPKDQARLEKYTREFEMLVEKYRKQA